jgi:type IV pilus assembly protein PilY1
MRTFAKRLFPALALFTAMAASGARAADTDLFSGIQASGVPPNVLVVLDNSGAWNSNVSFNCPSSVGLTLPAGNVNTAGGFEQCALYSVMNNIATNTALLGAFNMGMMLFSTGSGNGGTFFFPATIAPSALPLMDKTGIASFQSQIAQLKVGGSGSNTANGSAVGATMQEVWAFYSAKTGFSGTRYASSPIANACQKNFLIYIVNATNTGKPQDNTDNAVFQTLACPAGLAGPTNGASCAGATSAQQAQISLNPTYAKYQGSWADEWARFAYQTDISGTFTNQQNIVTYTIAVTDGSNPDYVQLLRSMASNGGGKFFTVNLGDMDALLQAILKILNEVQAVNSVFASASLPVSANAQGTFQNQIFMGMFRPDPQGNPRWVGNLKQFQFGTDLSSGSVELFMADATGARALSSAGTGFISANAISFWTSKNTSALPDSIGGFWVNKAQGASGGFDLPDGEVVEKGGVSQQIRLPNLQDDYSANPTSPRNVYTFCPSGTGCITALADGTNAFATTNSSITAAMLQASGNAISISSITRTATTATVTLASAPNPALAAGQRISITGSTSGFNGAYTVASVVSATQFTVAVSEIPPTPATGTFLAAVPLTTLTLSSLTRSSTSSTTAVATTGSTPHGLVVGQQVTISGGTAGTFSTNPLYAAYYGTFAVTSVPSLTQFTYTVAEGPVTPRDAASATATVGSTTDTLTSTTNILVPAPSIQRAASTLVSGVWTSTVTVSTTVPMATPFVAGATVKIAGTGTQYDGTWTITSVSSCPNGTKISGKSYSFCFNMPTTPAMPNPAPTTAGESVTATPVSGAVILSSLVHAASTCPTSPAAIATATTSSVHTFVAGQTVNVGGTPGTDENGYVGNFTVLSAPNSTTFTYSISTRPLCSDSSATSPGMIATTSGVTRDTLMRWVRGEDNFGDESSPGNPINIRPSVHGDVVHARPTVVNYAGSTGVVVYYGAGDGTFRAVNGNQPGATSTSNSIGTTPPGGELWAFIPPEFYGKLLRQHDNSPLIKYFSTSAAITPTPLAKDYFFDGIAGLYQNFTTGKVFLFLAARRGGSLIYALDVSDPTKPLFMWKHSSADTGFGELGQTWSTPRVAIVKGYSNPTLIFGAGYDPNEDAEPPAADTMGRGIFILDAVTGAIVWRAAQGGAGNSCQGTPCLLQDMRYAVPADITLLDVDADGKVDRAYAADLGGNIWRVDFEPAGGSTPGFWQVNKLAALGGASTDTTKRKFFFPPDAVATSAFTAVMAVTGDREHPLSPMQATSIVNRFYMLKDTFPGKDANGMAPIVDNTSDTANTQPASLFNATSTPYDGSASGFYVTLVNSGEKGVNAPTTVGGFTFFGTNTPTAPSPNSCNANLGAARSYQVGFLTGTVVYNLLQGGGLPPSPVTGLVNVTVGGQTVTVPFIIGGSSAGCSGADCQSSIGAQKANIPIKQTRTRAYWYRETDK